MNLDLVFLVILMFQRVLVAMIITRSHISLPTSHHYLQAPLAVWVDSCDLYQSSLDIVTAFHNKHLWSSLLCHTLSQPSITNTSDHHNQIFRKSLTKEFGNFESMLIFIFQKTREKRAGKPFVKSRYKEGDSRSRWTKMLTIKNLKETTKSKP